MPFDDQAKNSLNQHRGQIDSALSNALSDALGGEFAAEDLVLDKADVQKIMDQSLAMAEAAIGPGEMAKKIRRESITSFGNGQPNTPPTQNTANLAMTNPEGDEVANTLGPTRDNARGQTSEQTPNRGVPAQTAAEPEPEPAATPEAPDEGMQHCPHDGQILNPDGTCPGGDHSSLGGDPKKPAQTAGQNQPTGVGGNPNPRVANQPNHSGNQSGQPNNQSAPAANPQLPPPITPAIAQASIQEGAKKKISDLTQQIKHTKDKIGDINKKIKKNDNQTNIITGVSSCGCFTLILPIFGTIMLFINHQKKSKLKNEAAKLEDKIDRLTKERAKIAKQAKLKI